MQDASHGRQSGPRGALMGIGACIALASHLACAGMNKAPERPDLEAWPEIRPDFRVEVLRGRMHEYATTFAAEVDVAARAIEEMVRVSPTDEAVNLAAQLWTMFGEPEKAAAVRRQGKR